MNSKTTLALFLCFLSAAVNCDEGEWSTEAKIATITGWFVFGACCISAIDKYTTNKKSAPTEQPAAHNDEQVLGQTQQPKREATAASKKPLATPAASAKTLAEEQAMYIAEENRQKEQKQATRTRQNTFAWKKAEEARIAKEEADRAAQTSKKKTTPKDNIKRWYMVPILEKFQDSY